MAAEDVETKADTLQQEITESKSTTAPRLDAHGLPLRPQPSSDPLDPLNWNPWFKMGVLLQVSFLGFLGPFSQGIQNAAYKPLSIAMHVSVSEAAYTTTVPILLAGVMPLLWSPLSNVYGRRSIFIFVTAIGVAAAGWSYAATQWSSLLAARAFVGIGTSAAMGIGGAVVADMYFMHERGKYMGIYVVFVTNGAHLAAISGGFLTKYTSWHWTYLLSTIVLGATFVVTVFCFPETLYHRNNATGESYENSRTWISLFNFKGAAQGRKLKLWDITHCFIMFKYPSVLLMALYYGWSFAIGTVLFAVTGAPSFSEIYHFDPAQVGMAIGLSTLAGGILGELSAGQVSDWILYLWTKRKGSVMVPEYRLISMWPGFFLLPAGVIIEGVCLQYKTHWSGPVLGIGIGAFGLQIVSTNAFAYLTDCYKPQSAEISVILNFLRQILSFPLGFYMMEFAARTTFGVAWSVMAIIDIVLFVGIIALMWRGRAWRERLGMPNFDKDI